MDSETEDLKSLGFFGIWEEAYRLIFSWRTIFAKITVSLILPLCFIFLSATEIFKFMRQNINNDRNKLHQFELDNPLYKELEGIISSKVLALGLFYLGYFIFILIISLLSNSAVVYTVACIYVNNKTEISFSNVMFIVPKVLKRLMMTFLWSSLIQFGYIFVATSAGVVLSLLMVRIYKQYYLGYVISFFSIVYLIGFLYINIIWYLASVVSVLEEDMCGINAMKKSMELIKGKLWVTSTILFTLSLCGFIVQVAALEILNCEYSSSSIWRGIIARLFYWMACLLFLVIVVLVGLVIHSVIYFVCKSYHDEKIDKTSLDNHLKAYLEEYPQYKQKPKKFQQVQIV